MHPLKNPNPLVRRTFLVLVGVPIVLVYLVVEAGWEVIRQVSGDLLTAFVDGGYTLRDRCSYISDTLGSTKRLWNAPSTKS